MISRLESRLLKTESWYRDWNQDFWKLSLDIETGIKTLKSWVLILRLESRLLKFKSWYRDWNQDFQILSLDIETGIKTFDITVLISRLVLRLKKQGGIPVIETLARVTAHLWSRPIQKRGALVPPSPNITGPVAPMFQGCFKTYLTTHLFNFLVKSDQNILFQNIGQHMFCKCTWKRNIGSQIYTLFQVKNMYLNIYFFFIEKL